LQQQNGTLQNSGSQTVGRDALGTRGIAPGEAEKTVKIETTKNSNLLRKISNSGDQVQVSIKNQRRKGSACCCI
jgi:hypothetical protein